MHNISCRLLCPGVGIFVLVRLDTPCDWACTFPGTEYLKFELEVVRQDDLEEMRPLLLLPLLLTLVISRFQQIVPTQLLQPGDTKTHNHCVCGQYRIVGIMNSIQIKVSRVSARFVSPLPPRPPPFVGQSLQVATKACHLRQQGKHMLIRSEWCSYLYEEM